MVGSDCGGETPGHPVSSPSVACEEGVEVLDVEDRCASMLALAVACDLMSWSVRRIRCEVVARGPFGPGFMGFFVYEQSKLAFMQGMQGSVPEHRICGWLRENTIP